MAKKSRYFNMSTSPFEYVNCCDFYNTSWQTTPVSTMRVQRKLFTCSAEAEKEQKLTWDEVFLTGKRLFHISTPELTTPPTIQSSSETIIQAPLAPVKTRKCIEKIDLKPKKLIFKDLKDELESIATASNVPVVFRDKSNDNTPEKIDELERTVEEEINAKFVKNRKKKITICDDKENFTNIYHPKSKINVSTTLSQRQQILNVKGHKHFRI